MRYVYARCTKYKAVREKRKKREERINNIKQKETNLEEGVRRKNNNNSNNKTNEIRHIEFTLCKAFKQKQANPKPKLKTTIM